MKVLSGLLFAPTLAAVLLLACNPTNAAHRGGGSAYDGTWSVAIYTLRGNCGSVRVAARIVGGRVYSKDESYQASAFCIWLRQAVEQFRLRKLAVSFYNGHFVLESANAAPTKGRSQGRAQKLAGKFSASRRKVTECHECFKSEALASSAQDRTQSINPGQVV